MLECLCDTCGYKVKTSKDNILPFNSKHPNFLRLMDLLLIEMIYKQDKYASFKSFLLQFLIRMASWQFRDLLYQILKERSCGGISRSTHNDMINWTISLISDNDVFGLNIFFNNSYIIEQWKNINDKLFVYYCAVAKRYHQVLKDMHVNKDEAKTNEELENFENIKKNAFACYGMYLELLRDFISSGRFWNEAKSGFCILIDSCDLLKDIYEYDYDSKQQLLLTFDVIKKEINVLFHNKKVNSALLSEIVDTLSGILDNKYEQVKSDEQKLYQLIDCNIDFYLEHNFINIYELNTEDVIANLKDFVQKKSTDNNRGREQIVLSRIEKFYKK